MDGIRKFSAASGAGTLALGLWAFVAPRSFYSFADYGTYNRHFIHDIGAFMVGLAAVLLLLAAGRTAAVVALGGNAAAAVLHLVSHVIDADLSDGGTADAALLGAVAAAFVVAAVVAIRREGAHREG